MDQTDDNIPPQLREALRSLYEPQVQVPAKVDDAIMNRARATLAGRRRGRTWWRATAAGIATAAAVITVAVIVHHPAPRVTADTRDVNGDGRVDVLDALYVARNAKPSSNWDFNHDGVVDRRDADAIAQDVVKLTPGVLP